MYMIIDDNGPPPPTKPTPVTLTRVVYLEFWVKEFWVEESKSETLVKNRDLRPQSTVYKSLKEFL